MSPYERLFWVGCGMGMVITASCMLLPWVVMGEMQRQREAEQRPSNVVRWAEMREPRPRDELDDLHHTYHAEYTRSQAGFAANPAPAMGERGERMVPRRRE